MHWNFSALQLTDYIMVGAIGANVKVIEGVRFQYLLHIFLLLNSLLLILHCSLVLNFEHRVIIAAALRDFILHLNQFLVHLHGIHVTVSWLA